MAEIFLSENGESVLGRCVDFKTKESFIKAANDDAANLEIEPLEEDAEVKHETMIYTEKTLYGDNLTLFTGDSIIIEDYWLASVNQSVNPKEAS